MRKVIVFTNISLDGFIAGPHDDITWVIADRELHEAAIDLLKTADTVLYGRKTYQMMRDYWPTAPQNPSLPEYEVAFANVLNPLQKIVFSTTLETTDWNTTIRRAFHPEEIEQLKQEEGEHIVLGGATIAQQCMQHDLIDEIRLVVHPVVLGSGKPLFKDVSTKLKLLQTETFPSGVVRLYYKPAR